jgi:hypothetical protein
MLYDKRRKTKKQLERELIDLQAEAAWERDHADDDVPTEETDGQYEEVQGECSDDD